MTTENKRYMISVNKDLEKQMLRIKKEQYYDKPNSDMTRDLLRLGINAYNADKIREDKKSKKGEK